MFSSVLFGNTPLSQTTSCGFFWEWLVVCSFIAATELTFRYVKRDEPSGRSPRKRLLCVVGNWLLAFIVAMCLFPCVVTILTYAFPQS